MVEATGIPVEDALGNGWFKALHPDDTQRLVAYWTEHLKTGQPVDVKYRIRLKDGSYRWVRARASARRTKEGAILKWYGAVEDIDDVEQATERLRRQAYQDEVTRLPNRRAFEERLAGRLQDNAAINVLMLDINGFKSSTSVLGTKQVMQPSACLDDIFESDAASRYGRTDRRKRVCRALNQLSTCEHFNALPEDRQTLENQLSKSSKTRLCGVSIGCVEAQERLGLIGRATGSAGVGAAKRTPTHRCAFTPALPKASECFDQIELARTAIVGLIMPVYQPKMDLRNGAIAGAEALLRIDHPRLGIQSRA